MGQTPSQLRTLRTQLCGNLMSKTIEGSKISFVWMLLRV